MEHKTWLWRKKSSQKITSVNGKSDLSLVENGEEKDEAQEFEKSLKDLNQQLFDALNESNAKDDLLAKQAKVAEEAIAGWEKAEAEAVTFKQDLDEVLLQRAASDEKIRNLDVSLKECMHLLHVLKEENQQIISDAAMKISREQEKAHKLEVRLAETDRKLLKSSAENSNLSRVLEFKEKTIEELNESKNQSEENFAAIVAKLDALEKNNASLVYEVCMLQKELEIQNAEREFNRKSADAAHRQHLGNMKRIGKLEKECQKLRVMLRNRLPGPAALSKMRSEVELLDHTTDTRRKKLNDPEYAYDVAGKSVGSLIEQLNATEDENKIVKETLSRKNSELQSLRVMFARTASKLSQAETQLEESPRVQAHLELARSSPVLYDFPLGSISEDACTEDSINCAESWASALISELENFRPGKPVTPTGRTSTSSDLSLMDDFIEMERLAIESADKPFENSDSKLDSSEVTVNTLNTEFKKSVFKLVELIEGIIRINSSQQIYAGEEGGASPCHKSALANGYIARVFLWETSELSNVLRCFVDVCTTLLHGKGDLKVFSGELASTLEWMMDHSIPLEDVSKMKETFKNHIGDYESHSNNKVEAIELKFDTSLYVSQMETIQSKLTDENKRLKHEILNTESSKNVLEEQLESVSAKNLILASRLEESTKSITDLQVELETLKENQPLFEFQSGNQNSLIEYQSGNQNSMEDLGTQLTVTRVEYHPKFSTHEVELDGKSTRCDESEASPELPLQLESVSGMGIERYDTDQEQKQLRTDFEISAASKKLAECQETIQNLGKQLKALASPRDAPFFDKMISIPVDARINRRPQLLDHMREEDNVNSEDAKSPITKEVLFTEQKPTTKAPENHNADLLFELKFIDDDDDTDKSVKTINPSLVKSPEWICHSDESGRNTAQTNVGTLALVLLPKKQKGGIGLLRKLLLRKRA